VLPGRGELRSDHARRLTSRAPLPGLAISNGLFPGLAGVVKTLADEHGPARIRVNGLLPVRIATDRVRQLDALRAGVTRDGALVPAASWG
jgi:hypothetical protein